MTVSGNTATDHGGGIYSDGLLTVSDTSWITWNTAGNGGGIANNGTLTVQYDVRIANNTANESGGGIYNNTGATATILLSQIQNNVAGSNIAFIAPGHGGGIMNLGTLQMSYSTLSDNSVTFAGCRGGGLYCGGGGTATLQSVVISGNRANNAALDGSGGGFYVEFVSALSLIDCSLTGNQADVAVSAGGGEVLGATY
ncbi:MAG: hypothetical protein L0Z53_17105, partial [Acidobacteriales bacterium]|nr:hypothetical protein [Terriglobales bacterium]